jgi:hypothetical protein
MRERVRVRGDIHIIKHGLSRKIHIPEIYVFFVLSLRLW